MSVRYGFKRDHKGRLVPEKTKTLTKDEIDDALERPSSFAYFGESQWDRDRMFRTWSLGPVIENRDSRLLDKSNAAALEKLLESDPRLKRFYRFNECSHWAVGWVKHVSYRVVDFKGRPTRIACIIKAFYKELDNYPIADEDDYSERESEATSENFESEAKLYLKKDPPEDWFSQVWDWFEKNVPNAFENVDDQGGWPSTDDMKRCLKELSLIDPDEE